MVNVFIEPLPRNSDEPATAYQVEHQDGSKHSGPFGTQEEAIAAARKDGHHPLVARVRRTDKGKPDQWRAAD